MSSGFRKLSNGSVEFFACYFLSFGWLAPSTLHGFRAYCIGILYDLLVLRSSDRLCILHLKSNDGSISFLVFFLVSSA